LKAIPINIIIQKGSKEQNDNSFLTLKLDCKIFQFQQLDLIFSQAKKNYFKDETKTNIIVALEQKSLKSIFTVLRKLTLKI